MAAETHINLNDIRYRDAAAEILSRHDAAQPEANITSAVRDFLIMTNLAQSEEIVEENPPSDNSRRAVDLTALEPVYNLFRISTVKARATICRLVLSFPSQFFHSRRHFSSQAKDRSTTQRFGSTTKVCSSLRFTTSTEAPSRFCTVAAKGFPV